MEPHDAPLKILACDFKNISRTTDRKYKWKITLGVDPFRKEVVLTEVWLQGFVTDMDSDGSFRLWDQTGEAVVCCDKVHEDKTWLEKDVYCGVIGEILEPWRRIFVMATRLINLSDKENSSKKQIHQGIWRYEVTELAYVLSGRIANPLSSDI